MSTYLNNENPHSQLIVPLKVQKSSKDLKFYRRRVIITSKNTRFHIQYCRLLIKIQNAMTPKESTVKDSLQDLLLCEELKSSECLIPQLISGEDLKLSLSITYDRSMSQIP